MSLELPDGHIELPEGRILRLEPDDILVVEVADGPYGYEVGAQLKEQLGIENRVLVVKGHVMKVSPP